MEAESRAAPGDLEDNDLASGTIAIVDRIRPHLGTILLGVLVLFAALAAWTLIQSQTTARLAAGWDDCLAALAEGDPGRLETVAAQYGGTPAAQWAEIVLADTALADGNRLLITDRAQGVRRLEEAAGRYTAVNAQRPGLLAAERATFGLARARESLGELAEAKRGYEALVAEYPESPFRPLAAERIAALGRESTGRWYKWFESRPVASPAPDAQQTKPTNESAEPAKPAAESKPAARSGKPAEPAAGEPGGTPAEPPAG
ncbi:MAG: tetratricopeptide repeat protein [Planctomycetota bacterium]